MKAFLTKLVVFFAIISAARFLALSCSRYSAGYTAQKMCFTNLKKTMESVMMYSGDYDDHLPPYFTFDDAIISGESPGVKFAKVADIHAPHRYVLICRADTQKPTSPEMEGVPNLLSYVHCQSMRALIPNYSEGNRSLALSSVKDQAHQPYLRDPIRGTDTEGILSPHGYQFNVGFLDGHVATVERLDTKAQL